jgi:hypothetical protein
MLKGTLRKVLVGLIAIVGLLAGVIATRPAEFTIERSGQVPGAPAIAFSLVNDFHAWTAWSPWEKIDPGMQRSYEGPASGVGSIYRWSGNEDIGSGSMTITESRPNERIVLDLEFIEPFPATNITSFTFAPAGDETNVTWKMQGRNGFMGKALSLVFDMEQMVGSSFERGLADLKAVANEKANEQANE